jgi:Rod binding domain-containing protein
MTTALTLAPGLTSTLAGDARKVTPFAEKARSTAQNFEAAFLNSMFQPMFAGIGQGPFGGGPGADVWRSFLTDEYAKTFAKAGGIGIADHVYRALIAQQETSASSPAQVSGKP